MMGSEALVYVKGERSADRLQFGIRNEFAVIFGDNSREPHIAIYDANKSVQRPSGISFKVDHRPGRRDKLVLTLILCCENFPQLTEGTPRPLLH